jgi:hypothetical protein
MLWDEIERLLSSLSDRALYATTMILAAAATLTLRRNSLVATSVTAANKPSVGPANLNKRHI